MSNKKTVILTGAAGFVGKSMTKLFIEKGYHVIGLDINEEELKKVEALGAEAIKIDMMKDDLVPIFKRAENGYLVHIAGLFKFDAPPLPLFNINVKMTKIVFEAAMKVKWKHIVHISTVGSYGTPAKNRKSSPWNDLKPYTEDEPKIPDNTYSITKFMGEKIAWKYHEKGLPITIVRPSLIYGPENRYGMGLFFQFASYSKNIMKGFMKYILIGPLAILGKGRTFSTFVHVDDISGATHHLIERDETIGEAYTVGHEKPVSTIEFFDMIFSFERLKINWKIIPLSRFVIKHYKKLMNNYVTRILEKVLSVFFDIYGDHMNYNNNEIPIEVSSDWIGYFQSNYIWDISKLIATGYKLKHPDMRKAMLENLIWYKKNNWIP